MVWRWEAIKHSTLPALKALSNLEKTPLPLCFLKYIVIVRAMGFYNPYITSHHSNPPPYDINDRDDYQPISQQQRGPYLRESSAERSRYSQSNLRSPSSGRPSPTFTALSSPGDVAQSSKLMSSEDGAIVAKMIEWVPPSPNKSPDVIRILIVCRPK